MIMFKYKKKIYTLKYKGKGGALSDYSPRDSAIRDLLFMRLEGFDLWDISLGEFSLVEDEKSAYNFLLALGMTARDLEILHTDTKMNAPRKDRVY
jgi:hypothetical protein